MEAPRTRSSLDEAFDEWKRALNESSWAAWPERIQKACRDRDFAGLREMDPFPSFKARRNILHIVIFESDGDFECIEEKFRLPVVQAMVETAPDEKSRQDFVNKPDDDGVTPLQMAAMEGHADIAGYLIEQGAKVNSRDKDGTTPLHWAAENLRLDVVKLLLKHLKGEDRMPYDDEFCSPLDLLERYAEKGDKAAAEEIIRQLGGRQPESPRDKLTDLCQIVAFRVCKTGALESNTFDKPVSELLYGYPPVLRTMRDRLLAAGGPEPPKRWGSFGVFLPQNNLQLIVRAAEIIFEGKVENQALLDFIYRMAEPGELRGPGYYPATPLPTSKHTRPTYDERRRIKQVNDALKDVYCIVLPILDVDRLPDLRRRRYLQSEARRFAPVPPHDEQRLSSEQSLDEYCHSFLNERQLDYRDTHQVVSRYSQDHNLLHLDEIVVVFQLWIWRFGDFLIFSYGNAEDTSFSSDLCEKLSQRVFAHASSLQNEATSGDTNATLRAIMEECVRYEPRFPRMAKRELLDGAGAFAGEIDIESSFVSTYFQSYLRKLGHVDKHYKDSVRNETETLLNLDDALAELAMIRRVREDLRLICMDRLNNRSDLDRWAERSESKLRRLENDASRIRKSLVTLLALKQREVNTESLINSKLQSQTLVVFTAATVLFVPLSWISSLMALEIEGFSPVDAIWSLSTAATASIVTLVGFVGLMLLTLLIWWWAEAREDQIYRDEDMRDPDFIAVNQAQQRREMLRGPLVRERRGGRRREPRGEEV